MARGCGPRQGRSTRPLGTNDGLKITAVGRSPKPCRAGSNPAARAKFLDVRELPKLVPTPTLVLPAPSPRSRGPPSQNPNASRRRARGRKEAKRRFVREEMDRWLTERDVTLIGAHLDESPMAYRRLPELIADHAGTIKVLHTLRSFAVAMVGVGETDPLSRE